MSDTAVTITHHVFNFIFSAVCFFVCFFIYVAFVRLQKKKKTWRKHIVMIKNVKTWQDLRAVSSPYHHLPKIMAYVILLAKLIFVA